jgi:hypothetical protein
MKTYDVVFHDGVGLPYRGDEAKGLGGSEFSVIRLAKALASRGVKVLVQNNLPRGQEWTFDEVDFIGHRNRDEFDAKTLILQRYSQFPTNVGFDKLVVQLHDMPEAQHVTYVDSLLARDLEPPTIVFNSEWQRSLYPKSWPAVVIPCLLPIMDVGSVVLHRPGHFVYASAAMKGLKETLDLWERLVKVVEGPKPHLHIISSWDAGSLGKHRILDTTITVWGQLTHEELTRLIASCEGMFYVNSFAETFCVTAAMAERLGTRVHILCKRGFGALREVLADTAYVTDNETLFVHHFLDQYGKQPKQINALKDYSVEAGVKRWLEII